MLSDPGGRGQREAPAGQTPTGAQTLHRSHTTRKDAFTNRTNTDQKAGPVYPHLPSASDASPTSSGDASFLCLACLVTQPLAKLAYSGKIGHKIHGGLCTECQDQEITK